MTDFVEPKIRPLVEALNAWPGIKTFSSCEGHEAPDHRSIPHVTFTCADETSLRNICQRLRGTRWKITLDDFSYGQESHFTLRHVPRSLEDRPTSEELQAGVPSIADMLQPHAHLEPGTIENTFPRLHCSKCRGNAFRIQAHVDFRLAYADQLYPTLEIKGIESACIICDHCLEDAKTGEEAVTETWNLIDRTNNEGALLTEPKRI